MNNILKNVNYMFTTSQVDKFPKGNLSEVLIIGKSNVGKSSFINAITNNNKLAKISKTPGKTQALSFFNVNEDFILIDSPGYGYAKVSKDQIERHYKMFNDYISNSNKLKAVIVLLDLRRNEISNIDLDIIKFFKKHKMSIIVIGTKLDKLKQKDLHAFKKSFEKNKVTESLELITFSSITRKNIDLIIKRLYQVAN